MKITKIVGTRKATYNSLHEFRKSFLNVKNYNEIVQSLKETGKYENGGITYVI